LGISICVLLSKFQTLNFKMAHTCEEGVPQTICCACIRANEQEAEWALRDAEVRSLQKAPREFWPTIRDINDKLRQKRDEYARSSAKQDIDAARQKLEANTLEKVKQARALQIKAADALQQQASPK
jgi:hypothetical protein